MKSERIGPAKGELHEEYRPHFHGQARGADPAARAPLGQVLHVTSGEGIVADTGTAA